jgi:hypothetical protein
VQGRGDLALFSLAVLACCAWILWLPVFPSEDGPVHVYYATVMAKLLGGVHGPLTQAFRIRHLLPPYSLYYYLLIVLLQLFPAVLVEQIIVCITIVMMATGFYRMCTAAGRNGRWTAFLVLPLLLNWPLFMGFQNYCLSIGLCFWALATWFGRAKYRRAVFLLLVILVVLTHPVPLLPLAAICAIDLLGRWMAAKWMARGDAPDERATWRRDLLTLACGCACMSYVLFFTETNKVRENLLIHIHPVMSVMKYSTLYGLGLFARASAATLIYTALLFAVLLVSLFFAARAFLYRRSRAEWRPADALLLATLALLVILPFLPDTMNGGFYFNNRFLILVWCGAIAAASDGVEFAPPLRSVFAAFGCAALAYTLVLAQIRIAPVARRAAEAERAPIARAGENAILLPASDYEADPELRFRPLEWSAVRYFRRAGDVMLDAPFLDMSTMPVDSRGPQLEGTVVPGATNDLKDLLDRAKQDPRWASVLFRNADLVVFRDTFHRSSVSAVQQKLQRDGRPQMRCVGQDWLYFCRAEDQVFAEASGQTRSSTYLGGKGSVFMEPSRCLRSTCTLPSAASSSSLHTEER